MLIFKFFKPALLLFLFALLPFRSAAAVISPGEELLYEVSFLGIKLGSIKVITEDWTTNENKSVCKAKAFIDTYSGIPFVDLHTIFESWMDPSLSYSHKFVGHTKEKNYWLFDQILFDYDNKAVRLEKWKLKNKYYSSTINTPRKWNDGMSLYFFARQFTKSNKNVKVPTIIDKDTVTTIINFVGKRENVEIDAINYPVRTVYFNGSAIWTSIYGLTGRFEGWFSDDDASVPIKAKMKVYVGSINIELISWKRSGWVPPKG